VHSQGDKTLDTYSQLWLRRTSHDNARPADEYADQHGQPVRDRGCGCLPDCLVVNRQGAVVWQRHVLHAAGPEPEINVNAQKLPRKHKSKRALVPSPTTVFTRSMAREISECLLVNRNISPTENAGQKANDIGMTDESLRWNWFRCAYLLSKLFANQVPHLLHCIDGARAYLHFFLASRHYLTIRIDRARKIRAIFEYAKLPQDCWNNVVSKYSDGIDVVELAIVLSLEGAPQISDKDLSSLVQENLVSLVKWMIPETCQNGNLKRLLLKGCTLGHDSQAMTVQNKKKLTKFRMHANVSRM